MRQSFTSFYCQILLLEFVADSLLLPSRCFLASEVSAVGWALHLISNFWCTMSLPPLLTLEIQPHLWLGLLTLTRLHVNLFSTALLKCDDQCSSLKFVPKLWTFGASVRPVCPPSSPQPALLLHVVLHVSEFLLLFSVSVSLPVAQMGKSQLSSFQVHWCFFLQVKITLDKAASGDSTSHTWDVSLVFATILLSVLVSSV